MKPQQFIETIVLPGNFFPGPTSAGVMPWVSALLFVVTQPSALEGTVWTLVAQGWAFLYSAIRMVFCLGVLHHSGLLFFPLLWFGMGTLSDLLILLLFYSLSIHRSGARMSSRRLAWQS